MTDQFPHPDTHEDGRAFIDFATRDNPIHIFGFRTYDINRIFASTFGTNAASKRVLEKSGFILEAQFPKTLVKNGTLLDELIYAVRR